MRMKLEKYMKKDPKKYHTTSVNISHEHREFLKKHGLEVSSFVRAVIDELIEEHDKKEDESLKEL
jgi:hypothetical protein